MPSERQLNVSLSMKIKGESTSVKVLPWDPFATFNVAVLIHYFVHIGCSIPKTGKWLKFLTLPLPISKCLQVSTMFASLTAGLMKNVDVLFSAHDAFPE